MRRPWWCVLTVSVLCAVVVWRTAGAHAEVELPLDRIKLPQGFTIRLYADKVYNARSLALGANGTVFVGTRVAGKVYAVVDQDNDHFAETTHVLAAGLKSPNGVAFHEGSLYVAEVHRIIRYDDIESQLAKPPKPVVVTDELPEQIQHAWKYLRVGPDGKLYVPVGAPCNACESEDERFATIMRLNPNGSGLEVFARGVRNSVGFDWNPLDQTLWFTDNGRDLMDNNVPPDELNRAPEAGKHFGFPYCHAAVPDPKLNKAQDCTPFTPPALELGPHVAALGMRFYTGSKFPGQYRQLIFIAEHGSWNRSNPIGYRIGTVRVEGDRAVEYRVFAEGWLTGDIAWGRPVDLLLMPDGALLVSDDAAGVIYRISYRE